jgi:uncharacterized secreted repeat protein (TIGR03808 family)
MDIDPDTGGCAFSLGSISVDRRSFLTGALGVAVASPAAAALDPGGTASIESSAAPQMGLIPDAGSDQSQTLQRLLDIASDDNREIFLPPGTYVVSEIVLPPRTRLAGVPGGTRLVFGGGEFMIAGKDAELVALKDLTIDGGNRPLADVVPALVHRTDSRGVALDDCAIERSAASGVGLDRCAGRVRGCTVRGARDAGIRAIESKGLTISDNAVADCGNGGILVWRWTAGEDGTIVTGNRIERIAAGDGGTGQNGNGVSIFRAHGVIVANNRIAGCAFTAVRANSASNVQITGNNCRDCGEVGIYSEYAFEGAMIANNIIDTAATGISVVNLDEGGHIAVVSGNIVRNLTGKGPYAPRGPGFGAGIVIEADTAATGNVIDGAPLFGMMIGWGPYLRDVAATGNVIRRAPIGIAVSVVDGAGSVVISDNLISGASHGAVRGMRWAEPVSGDLARSGADAFPNLLVERNQIG